MSYDGTHVKQKRIWFVETCKILAFIIFGELAELVERTSLLTRQSPETWLAGSNPALSAIGIFPDRNRTCQCGRNEEILQQFFQFYGIDL